MYSRPIERTVLPYSELAMTATGQGSGRGFSTDRCPG